MQGLLAKKRGQGEGGQKVGSGTGKVLAVPVSMSGRGGSRADRGKRGGGSKPVAAANLHPAALKITIRNDKVTGLLSAEAALCCSAFT